MYKKSFLQLFFGVSLPFFLHAQAGVKTAPLSIVKYGHFCISRDSIYLEEISTADLQEIVANKKKAVIHIWYPWCAEQQDAVKQFAETQKMLINKGIPYYFISDNNQVATTIPALFYKMGLKHGFVIPLTQTLKEYKKMLHKTFHTSSSKHTVFYFEDGKVMWEGFSYQAYGKKKLARYLGN